MKFLVTKELTQTPYLKYLIAVLSFFILVFLQTDIALHHTQIGLVLEEAVATLLGNEETFEEPILLSTLMLQVHIDLFLSMFILLTLLAMYIRLFGKEKSTKTWIHLLFTLGLASPLLLLLAFMLKMQVFIMLWLVVFFLWHSFAFYLALKIIWKLFKL